MDEMISVLIPTYNRRESLIKAIKSCLSQTYKDIEVIITDNSGDCYEHELISIFDNDCRIKYYKNNENIGPILNWKEAYSHAKGKYWMLLPDDDFIINPFYFEDAIKILNENDDVAVLFTDCILSYPGHVSVGDSRASGKISSKDFISQFWAGVSVPTIANIVRKETSDQVIFFYDNEILYSDIELWLKISEFSDFFFFYKIPSINYIFGSDNIVFNMQTGKLVSNSMFLSRSVVSHMIPEYVFRYVFFITGIYPKNKLQIMLGVFRKNNISKKYRFIIAIRLFIACCKRSFKKNIITAIRKKNDIG